MPLAPFDELDQAGLRVLGFTIDFTREQGELAVVAGQMEVLLHRSDKSGEDWLTLIITLPNGREFVAHAPRDELKDFEMCRTCARRGFGGTPATDATCLLSLSGLISFLVPLTDGSLIQTGVVGSDGAVGALQALDARVSPSKIVVQMPSTAALFEADQFAKIAQTAPCVRSIVLSHAEFFLAEVQQSAACNAVHSVQQRMCRWLLRMNNLIDGKNIAVTQVIFSDKPGYSGAVSR